VDVRVALLAAGVLAVGGCRGTTLPVESQPSAGARRVLFVGNSLTYFNDLPGTLATLVRADGDDIVVASVTRPGYALIDHLVPPTASGALDSIRGARWDHVVLQQGPTSRDVDRDSLVLVARQLAPAIRASGGRPALYMVWPAVRDSANFDRVHESFRRAACAVDGELWPAGDAWRAVRRLDPSIALYGPDQFHPAPLGTYLAALVMYERLTGRDARRLATRAVVDGKTLSVSLETVRVLQRAAHEANVNAARACAV
jgi:hypothetical protein